MPLANFSKLSKKLNLNPLDINTIELSNAGQSGQYAGSQMTNYIVVSAVLCTEVFV